MAQGSDSQFNSDLELALANSLHTYKQEQARVTPELATSGEENKDLRLRKGRSASVSCDLGVIKTEVKPRSRPEVRKTPGQPPVHIPLPPPPPPHLLDKRRASSVTRISGSMDPNMNPRVADPKMNPRTEAEQDLISFLSPNPSKTKSAINAFDDLEALDLELPAKNNNMYAQQTDMVKALYREPVQNPSFYPSPFSTPPLHPHPSPAHPYQRQIYSPYPTQQQQQQHQHQHQQQQQPFKFYQNAPAFNIQPSMMSQTSVRASGPMSHPLSPMSHPWGLNIPQTHLLQRNAALHKQPLSLSFNQGMSKSLSWTDGDPSTSTPTHPSHQRRSSPCPSPSSPSSLGGIISPPPPSLRSSVSSYSLGSGKGRKVMSKVDNESLIDLDIDEKDKTTVSVLEEFDPLIEHKEDEDELYWTSRESTNSTSFYDSYDPFSYMADRAAEEISSPTTAEAADEADTDLPALPPKHKKIGIVRPLPEVSAAELSRRQTVARNYENIVKEDATFFKGIGVAKTRSVARDAEVLAFTDMVRQVRSKYKYSNLLTNPGLVLAARLEAKYPESTELKLVVFPKLVQNLLEPSTPVLFTANVLTELDQIIAKVAIELDLNMDSCSDFVLQVQGKAEYLQGGSLDQYEYVHHCYKYDRDVKLTLVHKDLVDRGLARSEEDDIEDSELSYDQISPLDKAKTLSHEDLKTLLEFLQKEAERITNTARTLVNCTEKNVIQSLNPRGMLQAVKAVCAKVGSVETIDLSEALEKFKQACVKYDCMKGNEDPAGKLRPEIVEVVGERYAMVTFKKVASEGFMQNAEDIKHCLKAITEKVYSLIRTYSRTFRVDFSLEEIDTLSPGELKDSSSVEETLLARIGCVHRLNPSWEYLDYRLDLRVYHGTRLIREAHSTTFQKPEHSHQQLHSMVTFNTWIDVKSLPVSIIPLEARLVMCLVGRRKDPENKEADLEMEIGWTAIQMYSIDKHLSQGSYLLALWPMEVIQQIGPAPDSSSHPQADSCPLLSLELLDLGGPVVYPDLDPRLPQSQDTTLDCLDFNTREQLESLCEQDIISFYKRPTLEREILWEKRFYLRNTPGALPKVLLSVRSWDPDTLKDLYGLLNTWPKPDIADTLQLFLPIFPDSEVRKRGVEWLEEETTDSILDILPQLVEAVKHETWIVSSLVRFLISRCLSSPMLTHSLYWHLTQCLPGVSPQNSDGGSVKDKFGISAARHQRRLQLLLRTLFVISGQALRNKLFAQQVLVQELYQAAEAVKTSKDNNRHNILARHMENLHHQLRTTPTLVPLSASMTASGVDVKSCQHFNSNTFPLKVVLNSAENDGGVIQIIYKVGDDLRQDMLTLQMIRVMDRLWLKGSLDLRIVYFSCVPTGYKSGIVEFVEHANTLREIQVAETGVTGTFRSETLNEWLQKHNPSQLEFKRAVSNFTRSCAGYSVVTYVLGICDRHNDNIMLKTSGHLFHIDFGKFLGDAQKFGAIKRDRVPFVLTPDMLYVINGGKGSTEKFHTFVELSCQAFNILRREGNLILTLFALMASSGIPGVTKEAVSYVHDRLLLDLSEEEAAARFGQLIHESINSSLSTQLNFFVHNLAQLKFGKSGGSEDNVALSFIPNKYSLKSDGKIKEVVVHGIQKRYDTEKHYVFILKISRQGIKDPAYIFRTYKQFCEFHSRLCTLYPMTKFPSITSGYSIGRSNIREVAEKRKREIGTFLSNLFVLAEEISHSDLVYTFFHPLLKDEEETSIHIQKLKDPRGHMRKPSVGRIKGRLKLKVYYRNQTLHVLIQFIENLAMNDAREEPNSYVKVYLHPDPTKQTKRKTKVVRRSCNPSFMEMLEYRIPLDRVRCRTLQATVWDSSQFQENMFLGSVTVPLDDVDLTTGLEQWFNLGQFYR